MKKFSWTIFILALVITIALIALEQYYVAIELVVGTVIMMHRELWSLLTKRKLPPVDERVKENTSKSPRAPIPYRCWLVSSCPPDLSTCCLTFSMTAPDPG